MRLYSVCMSVRPFLYYTKIVRVDPAVHILKASIMVPNFHLLLLGLLSNAHMKLQDPASEAEDDWILSKSHPIDPPIVCSVPFDAIL